jgi:hypothetical protein
MYGTGRGCTERSCQKIHDINDKTVCRSGARSRQHDITRKQIRPKALAMLLQKKVPFIGEGWSGGSLLCSSFACAKCVRDGCTYAHNVNPAYVMWHAAPSQQQKRLLAVCCPRQLLAPIRLWRLAAGRVRQEADRLSPADVHTRHPDVSGQQPWYASVLHCGPCVL